MVRATCWGGGGEKEITYFFPDSSNNIENNTEHVMKVNFSWKVFWTNRRKGAAHTYIVEGLAILYPANETTLEIVTLAPKHEKWGIPDRAVWVTQPKGISLGSWEMNTWGHHPHNPSMVSRAGPSWFHEQIYFSVHFLRLQAITLRLGQPCPDLCPLPYSYVSHLGPLCSQPYGLPVTPWAPPESSVSLHFHSSPNPVMSCLL